jgi:hypothetical protein
VNEWINNECAECVFLTRTFVTGLLVHISQKVKIAAKNRSCELAFTISMFHANRNEKRLRNWRNMSAVAVTQRKKTSLTQKVY